MKNWLNSLVKKWKTRSMKNSDHDSGLEDFSQQGQQAGSSNAFESHDSDVQPEKIKLVRNKFPRTRKPWSTRKKVILLSGIGTVAAVLIVAGVWAVSIMIDPLAQFNIASNTPKPVETQGSSAEPGTTDNEAMPTATIDPEDALLSEADLSILDSNFINIMLIGVDHAEERDSDDWTGKTDFHSDVMIVLTINKATGKVSMISLPRDTYAKIPGVDGVYKLNASLNCGGGWPNEGAFEKVCQAAQWMLGGRGSKDDPIVIPYYFAVDMGAVKGLVDTIGGVDYDVDISFSIQGRSYTKGEQHMDGQAVLDYLRVRKEEAGSHDGISSSDANGATGDGARVNRQKRMLVAIFEKIKANGLLASIPQLIEAFDGSLYYNMSISQIAALAWYAYGVDSDDIAMYSMSGSYVSLFGDFAFTITNQTNRVKIIKQVYGIDVPKRTNYTMNAAKLLWGQMQAEQYTTVAKPILKQVKDILEADAMLPEAPTATPTPSPTPTQTPSETPSPTPTPDPSTSESEEIRGRAAATPTPSPTPTNTGPYRKYGSEAWELYNKVVSEYEAALKAESYDSGEDLLLLVTQLKTDVIALCDMFGVRRPAESAWNVDFQKDYNEIYVDFR